MVHLLYIRRGRKATARGNASGSGFGHVSVSGWAMTHRRVLALQDSPSSPAPPRSPHAPSRCPHVPDLRSSRLTTLQFLAGSAAAQTVRLPAASALQLPPRDADAVAEAGALAGPDERLICRRAVQADPAHVTLLLRAGETGERRQQRLPPEGH